MSMSDLASLSESDAFAQPATVKAQADTRNFLPTRPPGEPSLPSQPGQSSPLPGASHRYHIEAQIAPDIVPLPSRFRVKVHKPRLIRMVLKEAVAFKSNLPVALSRPCVYGVFSRPVGGLAPREELCVGCLRCTVQYPDIVQIYPNPERLHLGDAYVTPEYVDTLLYEARTGRVPVRGAGYRGRFGGEGWDGLWTDMSEIVRPTRDGIHGREFISTAVDIGEKPAFLQFDGRGEVVGPLPQVLTTQVPFLYDTSAFAGAPRVLVQILAEAARQVETLALVPIADVVQLSLKEQHVAPVLGPASWDWLDRLSWSPRMVVLDGWDRKRYDALRERFAGTVVCVRVPMDTDVLELVQQGVRVVHLTANFRGYAGDRFVMDLIRGAHRRLVEAGVREEATLIGSGGIILAEHVPKAIICGLDAVGLDLVLAVALQARFLSECINRDTASLSFPRMGAEWGIQRIKNLAASWRDQLLEVLGAMGLREVRRLRGELGRCVFQRDVEREVFGDLV